MCNRLFSAGDAGDRAYVNLRDMRNEWTEPARAFAEGPWDRFCGFADPHFLTEVRRDFHARFWEMYLTCCDREKSLALIRQVTQSISHNAGSEPWERHLYGHR
jgi:hypothetical protein